MLGWSACDAPPAWRRLLWILCCHHGLWCVIDGLFLLSCLVIPAPFTATAISCHRSLTSDSLGSKASGREDVILLALRVILVTFFTLDAAFGVSILAVSSCLAGAAFVWATMFRQRFYHRLPNRFDGACVATYCWACLCLVVLHIRGEPSVSCLVLCVPRLDTAWQTPHRTVHTCTEKCGKLLVSSRVSKRRVCGHGRGYICVDKSWKVKRLHV
jgi:hypothetical protein